MIVNEAVTGAVVLIIGCLLGSMPSAYLFTRLATGGDIRKMGGGNVGGLNVFREVGVLPAAAVGLVDVCKGAAAVAIAYRLLNLSFIFVLLAGLGAVIGHNWMVWLKFSGGKGMGPAIGALLVLMPLYGYWLGTKSGTATLMAVLLAVLIAIKFFPTAWAAWAKTRTTRDFIFDQGKSKGR